LIILPISRLDIYMLKHWVAVNMVEGVGPAKLRKLLEEYHSIEEVCQRLSAPLDLAEVEIEKAQKLGIKMLSRVDQEYPELLTNIHDPPSIIYVNGEISPKDKKAIAIVGTRTATRYGKETAERLARELSSLGITILSGLAIGIDAAAHQGALEAGGRTLAVLGSGIDQIYPRQNVKLAEKIVNQGALISEFSLGQKPDTWTFPQRNRIISGLSLGVIIVEGHYDSGAMITAKLALEQGREVFAVPGNIELEQSKGPHWLIKQGAKLIESVDDVLDELQHVLEVKRPKVASGIKREPRDYSDLPEEEQKIMAVLSSEPKHVDEISSETGFPVSQVLGQLMMLEIKNFVRQLPGKMFIIS